LDTEVGAFFLEAKLGLTPYTRPHLAYLDAVRNKTSPYTNTIQIKLEALAEVLHSVSPSDLNDYPGLLTSAPVAQFGEDANGNSLTYSEVDTILPDDVMDPFVNKTTQSTGTTPADY